MIYFYSNSISENLAILNADESKHCVQVLRKKVGEEVTVLDGKGNKHTGFILEANKNACKIQIENSKTFFNPRNYNLHIAIAPTKNISRYEWFLEKACEIGVDQIIPINCRYSERKNIRTDRLDKILISAMKQSGNVYLPNLSSLCTFDELLELSKDKSYSKLIAYVGEKKKQIQHNYQRGEDVLVLIGPEGGFSDEELTKASHFDFSQVSLGESRLRTETAGVFVCSAIKILNNSE